MPQKKIDEPLTRRPRVEPPADLPLSLSDIAEVQELIRLNNGEVRPRKRLGSKEFLNHAFDLLGMEARRDPAKAVTVLKLWRELIEKHHLVPKNTMLAKVLYAWANPQLAPEGLHIIKGLLSLKDVFPEAFAASFDEKVATVSLRTLVQCKSVDLSLIEEVLAALPAGGFKRRVFYPLFAHCHATKDVGLCMRIFNLAVERQIELWDLDYHEVLATIHAAREEGEDTYGTEAAAKDTTHLLEVMAEHHPVVGADNAALVAKLLGGGTAEIDEADGRCRRCGALLQSFDLSPSDRSGLLTDVVEKLIKPRVEGTSHYDSDTAVTEVVKQERWKEFEAFKSKLGAMKYDTVIDGANVGYYGLNSWYQQAKEDLLRQKGVDVKSVPLAERQSAPFPVDVSPKFALIDDMRKAAMRIGRQPLIILHHRHLVNPPAENERFLLEWKRDGAVLSSPVFLNDDYCWMYAVLSQPHACMISNDQMRDHHFGVLQPRFFLRWRQRHRITYKAMYSKTLKTISLVLNVPRVYSVWVQQTRAGRTPPYWHLPYIAAIPVIDQATNRTTTTCADVELSKDGDDDCSHWLCTLPSCLGNGAEK